MGFIGGKGKHAEYNINYIMAIKSHICAKHKVSWITAVTSEIGHS